MLSVKQTARTVDDCLLSHRFKVNMDPFLVGLTGLLLTTAQERTFFDLLGELGIGADFRLSIVSFVCIDI
jgi:hypothetical protein